MKKKYLLFFSVLLLQLILIISIKPAFCINLLEDKLLDFGTVVQGNPAELYYSLSAPADNPGIITIIIFVNDSWIKVEPDRFDMKPGQKVKVKISLDTNNLSLGENIGKITIYSSGQPKQTIYKVLVNIEEKKPQIQIIDHEIIFDPLRIGEQASKKIKIKNMGGSILKGICKSNSMWLKVKPLDFSVPASETSFITIAVDTTNLIGDEYKGIIEIESNGGNEIIVVRLMVKEESPILFINPLSIDLGTVKSSNIIQKEITIKNSGGGSLEGQMVTSVNWILLQDKSFKLSKQESKTIIVKFDTTKMEIGKNQEKIKINTNATNLEIIINANRLPTPPVLKLKDLKFDFGRLSVSAFSTQNLLITNEGEESLDGNITSSSSYLTITPSTINISPQQSQTFKITIDPSKITSSGSIETSITITSNDPNKPTVTIPIKAYLPFPPKLKQATSTLDFGKLTKDKSSSLSITLTNDGEENLDGNIISNASYLSFIPSTFTILPTKSLTIQVNIEPSKVPLQGSIETSITISSNDPDQPKVTIPIKAYLPFPPKLKQTNYLLNFGILHKTKISQQSITITNTGEEELNCYLRLFDSYLICNNTTITILPSQSQTFQIKINPDLIPNAGPFSTSFQITTNDPDNPKLIIPIQGIYGILIQLTIGSTQASVNGINTIIDAPPLILHGRTMVPLRFLGENLGVVVKWIPYPTQEIQLTYGDQVIHLWIGKKEARIEYPSQPSQKPSNLKLDISPQIINGRTIVPLRFISESFGAKGSV